MTPRLTIQGYFDDGGGIEGLLSHFAIKAKRHPRFENLVLFKYDQIASAMGEKLVQECRGIILDEADNWRVVSRAFDKFFNHGEGHAAPIDWNSARVQEKLDGSLCVLYPYAGEWHVATSGTPDAGGEVNGYGITFQELFWKTLGEARRAELPYTTCGYCFFFELTTPYNRVVVRYPEAKLTLLGARNLETQEELLPRFARALLPPFDVVREFPLQSFEDVAATFANMSPLEQEGYVVVDGAFNRRKVKHPGYVALHHSLGGMSLRALVEIARSGETSEVIAAFPEFGPQVDEAKQRIDTLHAELASTYEQIKDYESQKEFALVAQKTRLPAALFQVRAKKSPNLRTYMRNVRLDSLVETLGYRTSDEIERPLTDAAAE